MLDQFEFRVENNILKYQYSSKSYFLKNIFLNSRQNPNHDHFLLVDKNTNKIYAHTLVYYTSDTKASFSFRSSYGAFYIENIDFTFEFINLIFNYLKVNKSIESLYWSLFPESVNPKLYQSIIASLKKLDFEVLYQETNQYIDLLHFEEKNIHLNEKRKYQKCLKQGFVFKKSTLDTNLDSVYDFLVESRTYRNIPLNIDRQSFINQLRLDPEHNHLFLVYDQNQNLMAISLGIEIEPNILYYFLPADKPDSKQFSPSAFLLLELIKYCQFNHYHQFDLGISSYLGILNEGLYNFKNKFSAQSSPKSIMEWKKNNHLS